MFCACPELQVSMLFMERMKKNESIQMKGFQPFSKYTGYSDSLEYAGPWEKEISVRYPIPPIAFAKRLFD